MGLPLFIWRDGGTLRARVGSQEVVQVAGDGDDAGFLMGVVDTAIRVGLALGVIEAGLRRLSLVARDAARVEKYLAGQWRKHKGRKAAKRRNRKGTRPSQKRGRPGSRRRR